MSRTTLSADDVLGAAPPGTRSGGVDAVTLLSILVVVRLVLPSQFVLGPLGGSGGPGTLLGLMLGLYWIWHRLRRVKPERAAALNTAAIAFGAIALASHVVAQLRPTASDELNLSVLSLVLLASWLGGLLLASDGVTSFERLRVLVTRLVVVGTAFAGFGLVQFVTRTAWVDRLSIPGLVINTPVYPITQRDGFTRPYSTAIHPIEFGSVIAMLLPLTIVFGLLGPQRGNVRWRNWIPAAVTLLAASLSSSRSTIIGVALGIVLMWPALKASQRLVGAFAALVLGIFVFVAVPGMAGTIAGLFNGLNTGDSSVASRVDSFSMAATYFSRVPIFGRGFGTFLPRYRIFDNQYLLALVEIGALGFVALLLLWVVPVVGLARVIRRSAQGSAQSLMGTGLLASCVVGGVGLAFFDGFGFPMMPAVWFVLLGLAGAYIRLTRTSS